MNERLKAYMDKQHNKLTNDLTTAFQLPVFVDEIAEDEIPEGDYHYFLIVYGDIEGTGEGTARQEVYVVYVTEKNPKVEENTMDIIAIGNRVPGFEFYRTVKERYRENDTDNYVDQVTIIFRRLIKYDS